MKTYSFLLTEAGKLWATRARWVHKHTLKSSHTDDLLLEGTWPRAVFLRGEQSRLSASLPPTAAVSIQPPRGSARQVVTWYLLAGGILCSCREPGILRPDGLQRLPQHAWHPHARRICFLCAVSATVAAASASLSVRAGLTLTALFT